MQRLPVFDKLESLLRTLSLIIILTTSMYNTTLSLSWYGGTAYYHHIMKRLVRGSSVFIIHIPSFFQQVDSLTQPVSEHYLDVHRNLQRIYADCIAGCAERVCVCYS